MATKIQIVVSDNVFALKTSLRKIELVNECRQGANPEDFDHWADILDQVIRTEVQDMSKALANLESLDTDEKEVSTRE